MSFFIIFLVDEKYLAIQAIMANTNWNNPKEQEEIEIVNFQKKIWDLYEEYYKLLNYFKKVNPDLSCGFGKNYLGLISKSGKYPKHEVRCDILGMVI